MVIALVMILVLGGLAGCMIFLDQQGDLASFRSFFSSSDSSSKKKKNRNTKKNADTYNEADEYGDYEDDGEGRGAGYLLLEGSGSGDLTGFTVILDTAAGTPDASSPLMHRTTTNASLISASPMRSRTILSPAVQTSTCFAPITAGSPFITVWHRHI